MSARQATRRAPSLAEFVRAKKKDGCPVCVLPATVLAQLTEARGKKISRQIQLEWLREIGFKVTSTDLDRHYGGRHEQ